MKEMRKVTRLQKVTEYGYRLVASFIQDTNERGVNTYCLRVTKEFENGEEIGLPKIFTDFGNDKDYGNRVYKKYLKKGYTPLDSYEFEPTKMDMR